MFESLKLTDGWGNGRDVEYLAMEVAGRTFKDMADDSHLIVGDTLILEIMQDWYIRLCGYVDKASLPIDPKPFGKVNQQSLLRQESRGKAKIWPDGSTLFPLHPPTDSRFLESKSISLEHAKENKPGLTDLTGKDGCFHKEPELKSTVLPGNEGPDIVGQSGITPNPEESKGSDLDAVDDRNAEERIFDDGEDLIFHELSSFFQGENSEVSQIIKPVIEELVKEIGYEPYCPEAQMSFQKVIGQEIQKWMISKINCSLIQESGNSRHLLSVAMDKIVTELQKVKSELHKRLSQVIGPLLHHIRPAELISSLIEVDGLERSGEDSYNKPRIRFAFPATYLLQRQPLILGPKDYDVTPQSRNYVGGFQYTNVPYTVQDAIRHTQTFGYQYLWVDSICIVQDDSEEVSSQLDQMCDIYGGAELTLVAAQGKDASHGMHTFWPPPTPAAKHLFPLDLNKFITPENLRGLVPSRFPEQDCEAEEIWLSALQWEEFTSETTPVYIPPLVVKSRLMLDKDYPKNGTPKIKDMFIPVHEASRKENEVKSMIDILEQFISFPAELGPERFPDVVSKGKKCFPTPITNVRNSSWYHRGWTMQERMSSKRLLIFTQHSMAWNCSCALKDLFFDLRKTNHWYSELDIRSAVVPRHKQWACLHDYSNVVGEYNHLDLTFDSDIMRAFAGMTSSFQQNFPGGFHFGLPVIFFHWCLLWQPHQPLRKRITGSNNANTAWPSWSWVLWHGELDFNLWNSTYNIISKSWSIDMRLSLQPTYQDHKGISGDLPPTLEKDWKRTPAGTFKHRSDIETEFLYPLPIPSEVPHLTTNQSQILRFNAQSIRFSLSKILSPRRHSCLTFLLGDHESNLVGIVRLNHSHDDSEARQQFERRTEEFIAISQGSVLVSALHLEKLPYKSTTYHSPFEELCELNCAQDKTYEFYNVLMVEWRNGIAHRKALGRVLKKAWDATPKRDVEVFLG
ncbi:hypothetical protein EV356DRAFT_571113 [Viridothelium virens]|uniref:Heterokaryon incompatibility domain-containing protein n=1 Tax=Viridothelium virens TaxID=1048519 RepID=A0A6A6GUG1_VIRVR|nr:hypothetical protein EV356DRAFT_571113 [Viridothelium virens]